jgi:hypothetical protein
VELGPDDKGAQRAEVAAATMIKSDETPGSIEGLLEFLRMPSHAQQLISKTGSATLPPILVTANSPRLATVYSPERTDPLMKAMLESGSSQVALWAEATTDSVGIFNVILHLEGSEVADWRHETARCEKGLASGPLASGERVRLQDLRSVAAVLEKTIPR